MLSPPFHAVETRASRKAEQPLIRGPVGGDAVFAYGQPVKWARSDDGRLFRQLPDDGSEVYGAGMLGTLFWSRSAAVVPQRNALLVVHH